MLAPRWRARREALLQQPQGRDLAAIHVAATEPTRARLTRIQRGPRWSSRVGFGSNGLETRRGEVERGQVNGSDVVDVSLAVEDLSERGARERAPVTLRRAARADEAPTRTPRNPCSTARQCGERDGAALLGARPCALAAVHPASRPDDHRETDTAHYDRGVARGSLFRPTPRTAPGALSLRHAPHPRRVPHVTRARPH